MFDLKQLFLTGIFAKVKLGDSSEKIQKYHGCFDDWTDCNHHMHIGRYGVVEFHFNHDKLFLIWCDNLHYLSMGNIPFDSWFIKKYKTYNIHLVLKHLLNSHAEYVLYRINEYALNVTIKHSDVTLHFESKTDNNEDISSYVLIGFGKSNHKNLLWKTLKDY